MSNENEWTIEDLARCFAEFQRRMEAIADVVEPCVRALAVPMEEHDARVLQSTAKRLLNAGGLTDEQTGFCELLVNAEDVGLAAAPFAWEAIEQIRREIGLR